ncbi:MAG: thioesterase [Lentisphaeria bacterium]|nr:thioesterase [Lentisphaeria bacterium]
MDNLDNILMEQFTIRTTELGPDGQLSLRSFMDYLQLTAICHADKLGVGMSLLREKNLLWVLSHLKLEIFRFPLGGVLSVHTYPSGLERIFATRQYEVTDDSGAIVGRASSWWLMLNGDNFRPVTHKSPELNLLPVNAGLPKFFPDLQKLKPPPDLSETDYNLSVRQSMLDINCHLNNAVYGAICEDVLSGEAGEIVRITTLQIDFHLGLRRNNRLGCRCQIRGDEFFIVGENDEGKTVFEAAGKFVLSRELL